MSPLHCSYLVVDCISIKNVGIPEKFMNRPVNQIGLGNPFDLSTNIAQRVCEMFYVAQQVSLLSDSAGYLVYPKWYPQVSSQHKFSFHKETFVYLYI